MQKNKTILINQEINNLFIQKEEIEELLLQSQAADDTAQQHSSLSKQLRTTALIKLKSFNNRLKIVETFINPGTEKTNINSHSADIDVPDTYYEMSLRDKINFLLDQEDHAISASRILSRIIELEPGADSNSDLRKKITTNLYTTLNNQIKLGELLREKVNGEFEYKLPGKS